MKTTEKFGRKTKDIVNFKSVKAITLISLVITIVVLIILAGVAIYLSLNNNGIFIRAKEAKEVTNKQEATDIINLKITTAQMNKYAEKQAMPTLKELSEVLRDDNEIQYVTETSKVAVAEYDVPSNNPSSIYTKLNKYPYEFEINSSLQLASINGIKIAQDNTSKINILWENPNEDTVAFNEQTVELANDEYDYLEILYKNVTIGNVYYVQKIYKGNYSTQLIHLDAQGPSFNTRGVKYIDDKHLMFRNNYWSGSKDVANEGCIPVKVIGYRF